MRQRYVLRRRVILLSAAVAALPAVGRAATNYVWNGGVAGNWSVPTNWTPDGVPGAPGDAVSIPTPSTVNYDYTGTSSFLTSLTLNDGGTLGMAANVLSADNESVDTGSASNSSEIVQSGGTNTVATGLYLAANSSTTQASTYVLTGSGLLSSQLEEIGDGGLGIFNQSGGVNSVGTNATNALSEYVGYTSNGTYYQTGGTNTFGVLVMGTGVPDANSGTGTYVLSGSGTITGTGEDVGDDTGVGIFIQSGGVNGQTTPLQVLRVADGSFNTGTYTLSATGTVAATIEAIGFAGHGLFNQSGGTNTISAGGTLRIGATSTATGTYILSGTGTLMSSDTEIGQFGEGTFNQSGGTFTSIDEYVGGSNIGIFNQTGGTNQPTSLSVLNGTYSLGGTGTLSPVEESIANGQVNQSGGSNALGTNALLFGTGTTTSGTAAYALSGGSLTTSSEDLGNGTTTVFNQSGGTNAVAQTLTIVSTVGSNASYSLSGGTLSTASVVVNTGGTFTQTGGTLGYQTFSQNGGTASFAFLNLIQTEPLQGELFDLSGGTLFAANENVSSTALGIDQSGGTNTVGTLLAVNGGFYGLGPGFLTAGSETITSANGLTGVFSQNGGTNTDIGSFALGGGGSYQLSGGTLTLHGNGTVAADGTLSIQRSGVMDLTSATLTISYSSGNDPISNIVAYLTSGYAAGKWNGLGIISSTVAERNSSQSALVYSIGYADGTDGLGVIPSGEIEVLPTLAGDAKLLGTVNFGDFQLLAQYFGQTGTSWDEGDFTYSGTTDFGDFQLLAQDFGSSSSGLTAGQLASLNEFADQFGDTVQPNAGGVGFRLVSVPEPGSMAVLICATGSLYLCRRIGKWKK
jgi:hypothetical protein